MYVNSVLLLIVFFKQKTAYEMRMSDWSSDVCSSDLYAVLGYSRLNRDITSLAEDLQDREEVRAGGRVAFARHWSVFGSAIVDLPSVRDDPLRSGDGWEPIRHRLGFTHEDDCLLLTLTRSAERRVRKECVRTRR